MEEDIQNHSPIVMFRGTPCMTSKFSFVNMNIRKIFSHKPHRIFFHPKATYTDHVNKTPELDSN